jgi:hypothetical protein
MPRLVRHLSFVLFIWGTLSGTLPAATASPLYINSGSFGAVMGNSPAAVSWTQSDTWFDVEIAVEVNNFCGDFPAWCGNTTNASADVYLTNAIGPGTTKELNEIASRELTSSVGGFQTLTAFSGLTLPPGTYYLVYSHGGSLTLGWVIGGVPLDTQLGPGVTRGQTFVNVGPTSAYEPASIALEPTPSDMLFSVTGEVAAVPEPASLSLVGAGALLLVIRRRYGSFPRD